SWKAPTPKAGRLTKPQRWQPCDKEFGLAPLSHLTSHQPRRKHDSTTSQKRPRNVVEVGPRNSKVEFTFCRSRLHLRELRASLGPASADQGIGQPRIPNAEARPVLRAYWIEVSRTRLLIETQARQTVAA